MGGPSRESYYITESPRPPSRSSNPITTPPPPQVKFHYRSYPQKNTWLSESYPQKIRDYMSQTLKSIREYMSHTLKSIPHLASFLRRSNFNKCNITLHREKNNITHILKSKCVHCVARRHLRVWLTAKYKEKLNKLY